MQPLHIQIQNINTKLDNLIESLAPKTPVQAELNLQQQLDISLAQIEGLKQALISQAQSLQGEVNQMQSNVEPIEGEVE